MDKRHWKINLFMFLCFLALNIDARPLSLENHRKLKDSFKNKLKIAMNLDKIKFQKAFEMMEAFSNRGISFVDARKGNPFLDVVIKNLDDRNKNDSNIPGKMISSIHLYIYIYRYIRSIKVMCLFKYVLTISMIAFVWICLLSSILITNDRFRATPIIVSEKHDNR